MLRLHVGENLQITNFWVLSALSSKVATNDSLYLMKGHSTIFHLKCGALIEKAPQTIFMKTYLHIKRYLDLIDAGNPDLFFEHRI